MGETDWRKLGLVLMGRAMLSKSLTQFSVAGQGCVPSLLFNLTPNYGGGNEDNGDLLQKVHACTATHSAPNPAAGHCQRQCWRLLDTHRQVWVSLLCGHRSFLLDLGAQNILFVTSMSLFAQSCVSSHV